MNDFLRERFRKEGHGLIFRLKLTAIGEGIALDPDHAISEQIFARAIFQCAGDFQRQREFARESRIVLQYRSDIAAVILQCDLKRCIGRLGGIDEGDAPIARKRLA